LNCGKDKKLVKFGILLVLLLSSVNIANAHFADELRSESRLNHFIINSQFFDEYGIRFKYTGKFSETTQTKATAYMVVALCNFYNNTKDERFLEKAKMLGNALEASLFRAKVGGIDVTLIAPKIDTTTGELLKSESYTQDMLLSSWAFTMLYSVTDIPKYKQDAAELLSAVRTIQEVISENPDSTVHGALPWLCYNYTGGDTYLVDPDMDYRVAFPLVKAITSYNQYIGSEYATILDDWSEFYQKQYSIGNTSCGILPAEYLSARSSNQYSPENWDQIERVWGCDAPTSEDELMYHVTGIFLINRTIGNEYYNTIINLPMENDVICGAYYPNGTIAMSDGEIVGNAYLALIAYYNKDYEKMLNFLSPILVYQNTKKDDSNMYGAWGWSPRYPDHIEGATTAQIAYIYSEIFSLHVDTDDIVHPPVAYFPDSGSVFVLEGISSSGEVSIVAEDGRYECSGKGKIVDIIIPKSKETTSLAIYGNPEYILKDMKEGQKIDQLGSVAEVISNDEYIEVIVYAENEKYSFGVERVEEQTHIIIISAIVAIMILISLVHLKWKK
jgi:hypothetical protein